MLGEASVELIVWLQATLPWLVPVAEAVTFVGDEDFYVLVFPLLYWSVSPRVGLRMGAMLLLSAGLNSALKLAFATPRPFWVSDAVEAHVVETSFGVPSGHAQNSVVVWSVLARAAARPWVSVSVVVLVAAVGVSRWVVGVHAVEDTLAGWTVGAVLLAGYVAFEPRISGWLAGRPLCDQVVAAVAAPAALVTAGVAVRTARAGWELPEAWAAHAAVAEPLIELDPMSLEGVFTASGALCGLGLGLILLHRAAGGFVPAEVAWRRVAAYPLGLLGVVALWTGLGAAFPGGDAPTALALRFVRYTLVGVWIVGVAPLLFLRVGFAAPAEAVSEPGRA